MIPKKYKVRQAILETLNNYYTENDTPTRTDFGKSLTNMEIHKKTGININDINKYHISLTDDGYITCCHNKNIDLHRLSITSIGRTAAIDKYFLNLGKRAIWNILKDTLTLLFAVLSLFIAYLSYKSSNQNTHEIEQLQKQIEQLKNK